MRPGHNFPSPRGRGLAGGRCCVFILALLTIFAHRSATAADPNTLWRIISQQCVPNQREYGIPKPCEFVDLTAGYVVLKDIVGATQFLVMPTERIGGMEGAAILDPAKPNYWEFAWQARRFVDERAHRTLPRDAISLAINSVLGRTQNEMHIHVDCVRPDVQAAIRAHEKAIGTHWAPFPVRLVGHDYMAMRVDEPDLSHNNPFLLLANGSIAARHDMAHYTIVVVGDPKGFVLFAGRASPATGNLGTGEELQDHACALAH